MLPAPHALFVAVLSIAQLGPAEAEISSRLQIRTERVEPSAVEQGLALRVGEAWQRWSIEVVDGNDPRQVQVQLRDDAGHIHTRGLSLEGETIEERSRGLASSLALLVEQLEASAAEAPVPAASPEPASPITGFVGLGPRVAVNPGAPADVDAGLSMAGGAWLLRDHLVPVAELAWAHSGTPELKVDALRLGAGALGGAAALDGRLWGGGGAVMRAQWAQARAASNATGWWASPAVVGALQYRGRILVVGLWIGADLLLPPLRARGDSHVLRWSAVRPMATLHIGLRLPPGPRAAREPK